MNDSLGVKIVYAVFFTGLMVFGGFIAALILSFTSHNRFVVPLVVLTAAGCIIFFNLFMFNLLKRKPLGISAISFFAMCAVSFAGIWMYESYQDSLVMVKEN